MISFKTAKTDEDIKEIANLANIIWHEHYTSLLGKAQVEYMVKNFQSFDAIKSGMENDKYIYYMAYYDETFCGYIGFKNEGEKVFLSKIYIESSYRGKKISKSMIDKVTKDYPLAKSLYLTVNRGNENSIAAYKKMGFEIIKKQVTDIGSGFVMDDYVMEKTI